MPDPIQLIGHVGVDSWIVRLSTTDSPRDDAEKSGFAVDNFDQRTAAVALATINTASHESGAGHGFGDHFLIKEVGVFAGVPLDERMEAARRIAGDLPGSSCCGSLGSISPQPEIKVGVPGW